MSAAALPASLLANPRLERWIKFLPDQTARIATGKVEKGGRVRPAGGHRRRRGPISTTGLSVRR